MSCQCCKSNDLVRIYETAELPIFQNKVYRSREAALGAERGGVNLLSCRNCGFAFNARFDSERMLYDGEYQNEQAHSPYFDNYLDSQVHLLKQYGYATQKIIEIGCGKGTFLGKLWDAGFDAIGFDKTYEGSDPRVVRDYYSESYKDRTADLYILRHTLEHIQRPLEFLNEIAEVAGFRGNFFIEVPNLEWILEHRAFWDIFYEHCNYFTLDALRNFFSDSRGGYLFQDQYMYVLAPLSALRADAASLQNGCIGEDLALSKELQRLKRFVHQHTDLVIWGAGAKGTTFVNTTDPQRRHISRVVDVNPNKSGNFIAGSGHEIVAPESLPDHSLEILVVNENYLQEVRAANHARPYRYHALGEGLD